MRAGRQAVASAQSHGPSPFQHPVQKQEYHGAAHRNRQAAQVETRDPSEPQLRSEVATDQRAGDAEHDRDDQPAGVSAWHDDLGQYSRNQPEHNPRDESHDDSSLSGPLLSSAHQGLARNVEGPLVPNFAVRSVLKDGARRLIP